MAVICIAAGGNNGFVQVEEFAAMCTPKRRFLFQLIALLGAVLLNSRILAAPDSEIVAISSTASSDYIRSKLPDDTFAPETFAYGEGGLWSEVTVDSSIDKIKFMDVAQTIAPALAHQNYISSLDPKTTQLLIMVYWGKTNVPGRRSESMVAQNSDRAENDLANVGATSKAGMSDKVGATSKSGMSNFQAQRFMQAQENLESAVAMEDIDNERRDNIDAQNANLLGYNEEWTNTLGKETGPLAYRRHDLVDELEDKRYFVILMAYDFQLLWKQKKHKLLWETRFSIRDRGHEFDKALGAMARDASKYFGQTTHGVVHKELPEGQIEFGEIKVIDEPAAK